MRQFAPLLVVLLLGASAMPADSQPYRARQGVQSGEVRSLDQILNGIRRERPGSLADVQGPDMGPYGEPRYRLKWLTPDGRVLWLDTDARTGRVLGVQGEDRGPPPNVREPVPPPPGSGYPRRFAPGMEPNVIPGGPPSGPPGGYGRPNGYPRGPIPGGRFGGGGRYRFGR